MGVSERIAVKRNATENRLGDGFTFGRTVVVAQEGRRGRAPRQVIVNSSSNDYQERRRNNEWTGGTFEQRERMNLNTYNC